MSFFFFSWNCKRTKVLWSRSGAAQRSITVKAVGGEEASSVELSFDYIYVSHNADNTSSYIVLCAHKGRESKKALHTAVTFTVGIGKSVIFLVSKLAQQTTIQMLLYTPFTPTICNLNHRALAPDTTWSQQKEMKVYPKALFAGASICSLPFVRCRSHLRGR